MLSIKTLLQLTPAIALGAFFVSNAAYAADGNDTFTAATVTYPPLEYKDAKTGELTGFNHDLMEAMAQIAGLKVNWLESSFLEQTSFSLLRTGRVNIQSGVMGDTPERRAAGVNFLDYMHDPAYLYTVAEKADQFREPDSLCGKNVANTRGSKMMTSAVDRWSEEHCVKAGKPPIVQINVASTPEQKLVLKQGRVDAAFTAISALVQDQLQGETGFTTVGEPLGRFTYGFGFLEKDSALVMKLKTSLDQIIAEGTYSELQKKWGLPVDSTSIGPTALINAGQ